MRAAQVNGSPPAYDLELALNGSRAEAKMSAPQTLPRGPRQSQFRLSTSTSRIRRGVAALEAPTDPPIRSKSRISRPRGVRRCCRAQESVTQVPPQFAPQGPSDASSRTIQRLIVRAGRRSRRRGPERCEPASNVASRQCRSLASQPSLQIPSAARLPSHWESPLTAVHLRHCHRRSRTSTHLSTRRYAPTNTQSGRRRRACPASPPREA